MRSLGASLTSRAAVVPPHCPWTAPAPLHREVSHGVRSCPPRAAAESSAAARGGQQAPSDQHRGARRTVLGRAELGRVRTRGDRARPDRCRDRGADRHAAGDAGHRRTACGAGGLVRPGDRRAPGWRWRLRGGEEGPRPQDESARSGQPRRRLRADRDRQSGHAAPRVSLPPSPGSGSICSPSVSSDSPCSPL